MTVSAKLGRHPSARQRDKAKGDSLTEYLPNHIIIPKNPTEQVGMGEGQQGDEPVLPADRL